MVGVVSNLGGLCQIDRIRGRRETPGSMVAANGGQKAAELYVKRYFGGGKGVALEIRKVWRGRMIQIHIGFRGWGRELWVSGFWDGDR